MAYLLLDLASAAAPAEAAAFAAEALRRLEEAEGSIDARRVTLLEGVAGSVALKLGFWSGWRMVRSFLEGVF